MGLFKAGLHDVHPRYGRIQPCGYGNTRPAFMISGCDAAATGARRSHVFSLQSKTAGPAAQRAAVGCRLPASGKVVRRAGDRISSAFRRKRRSFPAADERRCCFLRVGGTKEADRALFAVRGVRSAVRVGPSGFGLASHCSARSPGRTDVRDVQRAGDAGCGPRQSLHAPDYGFRNPYSLRAIRANDPEQDFRKRFPGRTRLHQQFLGETPCSPSSV